MTPGPLTYWLEQFIIIIALSAVILLLPLLPARHFVSQYWPGSIDELIVIGPDGSDRVLMPARRFSRHDGHYQAVARSRPLSLVAVETVDGELIHAFPIGTRRAESGELIFASRSQLQDSEGKLVLQLADESQLEIDRASIRRVFAPNQLTLAERVQLTVVRIVEAWGASEGANIVEAAMPEQGKEQAVDP